MKQPFVLMFIRVVFFLYVLHLFYKFVKFFLSRFLLIICWVRLKNFSIVLFVFFFKCLGILYIHGIHHISTVINEVADVPDTFEWEKKVTEQWWLIPISSQLSDLFNFTIEKGITWMAESEKCTQRHIRCIR